MLEIFILKMGVEVHGIEDVVKQAVHHYHHPTQCDFNYNLYLGSSSN